jgi:hypothetical protein
MERGKIQMRSGQAKEISREELEKNGRISEGEDEKEREKKERKEK